MNTGTFAVLNQVAPGAVIGVVATGSPVQPARWLRGRQTLEALGYRVKAPVDPSEFYGRYDCGFTNGSAESRARTLMELFADDEVAAIITARGGYGAMEILPLLDYQLIAAKRKPLVGYSDVTALLVGILSQSRIVTIHGATVSKEFAEYSDTEDARQSTTKLLELLNGNLPQEFFCQILRRGAGKGSLIAGNLIMLASLLGTPWDIDYTGAILVIEEVGEAPYRVHRALTQLRLAGKLDALSGLVFGRFSRCLSPQGPTVEEVFSALVSDALDHTDYPVYSGLHFGHDGLNYPLPLGCPAELLDGKLVVKAPPVA